MTKPSPTRYSETETRVRLKKMLSVALDAPYRPLKMTATLKERDQSGPSHFLAAVMARPSLRFRAASRCSVKLDVVCRFILSYPGLLAQDRRQQ
jgi:hypothetical protein